MWQVLFHRKGVAASTSASRNSRTALCFKSVITGVSVHQSRQLVQPRITTGWTATRTKHWTQRRWDAGERRRASNSENRNGNNRYVTTPVYITPSLPLLQFATLFDRNCSTLALSFSSDASFSRGGMWTLPVKRKQCLRVHWWTLTWALR